MSGTHNAVQQCFVAHERCYGMPHATQAQLLRKRCHPQVSGLRCCRRRHRGEVDATARPVVGHDTGAPPWRPRLPTALAAHADTR